MSTSKCSLKVSEERVQKYRARRNQYLSAAISDGGHELEVDPYAFEEGDDKFVFSSKKDKSGEEREPGNKHKVKATESEKEPNRQFQTTIHQHVFHFWHFISFNAKEHLKTLVSITTNWGHFWVGKRHLWFFFSHNKCSTPALLSAFCCYTRLTIVTHTWAVFQCQW